MGVIDRPPQISENDKRLIGLGSINPNALRKGVKMTLAFLDHFYSSQMNPNFTKQMAQNNAGLLRCRMPVDEARTVIAQFTPSQLGIFKRLMDTTKQMYANKLNLVGQVGNGENFWEVYDSTINASPYPQRIKDKSNQEIEIQPKEYVTFVPTGNSPDELLSEMMRFYDALLRAYGRIIEYGRKNNVRITMKFKDNLLELLLDIDSAVLYVPDSGTGKVVQNIIKEEMVKQNIKLGARIGRPESGFDLKINGQESSHRVLLGRVIAKEMEKDYKGDRKLAGYTDEQFSSYFIKTAEQAGRLNPAQIIEAI